MIQCYSAVDAQEASLLVLELKAGGIAAQMRGSSGAVAFGELPAAVLRVAVWVPEAELEAAQRVIVEFLGRGERAAALSGRGPWTCAACGEPNEPTFELCWSCGGPAPRPPA